MAQSMEAAHRNAQVLQESNYVVEKLTALGDVSVSTRYGKYLSLQIDKYPFPQ